MLETIKFCALYSANNPPPCCTAFNNNGTHFVPVVYLLATRVMIDNALAERDLAANKTMCRSIDASEGIINNLSSSGLLPNVVVNDVIRLYPCKKKDCRGVSWIRVWF